MLAQLPKINLCAALVVIGCFFLPWISVDCNGTAAIRLSGYQLATGKVEPDRPLLRQIGRETGSEVRSFSELDRDDQAGARYHFFVVGVCALAMIYYAIRMWAGRNRTQVVAQTAMSGAGMLFLLVLGLSDFGLTIPSHLALVLDTTYQIGYYLTFLAFLGALACNVIGLIRYTDIPVAATAGLPPAAVMSDMPEAERFIMQAGSDVMMNVYPEAPEEVKEDVPKIPPGGKTCPRCGAPAGEFQVQCMKCGSRIKPGKA